MDIWTDEVEQALNISGLSPTPHRFSPEFYSRYLTAQELVSFISTKVYVATSPHNFPYWGGAVKAVRTLFARVLSEYSNLSTSILHLLEGRYEIPSGFDYETNPIIAEIRTKFPENLRVAILPYFSRVSEICPLYIDWPKICAAIAQHWTSLPAELRADALVGFIKELEDLSDEYSISFTTDFDDYGPLVAALNAVEKQLEVFDDPNVMNGLADKFSSPVPFHNLSPIAHRTFEFLLEEKVSSIQRTINRMLK